MKGCMDNKPKNKHTPGPWFIGAMNDALFVINEPPRPAPTDAVNTSLTTKVIAKPGEPFAEGFSREEYEANARLIAAAPELLAIAREAFAHMPHEMQKEVDAVLCKVEGRE